MVKRVVIIGAGAVGMSVATYLKRHTNHDLVVFSSDTSAAYSQCGMPFVLEGTIPEFNNLILKPPESFSVMGIELHLQTAVNHIDVHDSKVITDIGVFKYDYLVIATGSTPAVPQIRGRGLEGVFTLHTLSDGMAIKRYIRDDSRIVIIGGGGIGTELSAGLRKRGMEIILIEALPRLLLQILDPDMALIVEQHLGQLGVRVITGESARSINGSDHVESVTVGTEKLPADAVIIAVGLKPAVNIAAEAGFDIGPSGAIVADERLRASYGGRFLDNIYTGGECAQVTDFVTREPVVSRLGSAARRMARVIAGNLSNEPAIYPPTLSPAVVVAGNLTAGSVGINSHAASKHGTNVIAGSAKGYTRAGYYPGALPLHIKLLFSSGRLVGAQVVSGEGVKERIDALSLAIRMGATIDDLLAWETAYSPPVSGVIDPVTFAAEDARSRMEE